MTMPRTTDYKHGEGMEGKEREVPMMAVKGTGSQRKVTGGSKLLWDSDSDR